MNKSFPISKKNIEDASRIIRPFVHRTPILSNAYINSILEAEVFFKCENFQKIGAFKMRGAAYALSKLSEAEKKQGVITHSSGNHAQALALSAKLLGISALIVMPETAPEVKIAAVKDYGAEVVFCKPNIMDRQQTVDRIQRKSKATFIPPFDDADIITGQATCAKELLEDQKELDLIICPVGGGGLLAGTALSVQYFSPKTLVWAGEPEGAADAFHSLESGQRDLKTVPKSIADGLLTSLGELNFDIIKETVERILLVNDQEILSAMQIIWERMKIIVEPSCAVPLAALIKNKASIQGKKIGLILSGGNVDLDPYFKYLSKKIS